jgi:hypothetical protein
MIVDHLCNASRSSAIGLSASRAPAPRIPVLGRGQGGRAQRLFDYGYR